MTQVTQCDWCDAIIPSKSPHYRVTIIGENTIPDPVWVRSAVKPTVLPVVVGDFCSTDCIAHKSERAKAMKESLDRSMTPREPEGWARLE